ncbi:hypothetical protein [Chitinophaga sp.]|uniref:hypothetical protein n=1 Tax=Chitinophaga sp. TaxID=1869181 RepID=UPI002F92EA93
MKKIGFYAMTGLIIAANHAAAQAIHDEGAVTIKSQWPIQNAMGFTYTLPVNNYYSVGFNAQVGLPFQPYTRNLIELSVQGNEVARTYLKENLLGKPGVGLGVDLNYRKWSLSLVYQSLNYYIDKKNVRELTENLIPEQNDYILTDLSNLADRSPAFASIYNNYRISSQVYNHQFGLLAGYTFSFRRFNLIKFRIEAGAFSTFDTRIRFVSENSNSITDLALAYVEPSLNNSLKENTEWRFIPSVSLSVRHVLFGR